MMNLPDTPLNRHIRRHLHNTGKTPNALDREARISSGTTNQILSCKMGMSWNVFFSLEPIVSWHPEHRAFMAKTALVRATEQWRAHVIKFICDKPIYARAW